MDFTIETYRRLLNTLRNQGFCFIPFSEYLSCSYEKVIVLRQDVDKLPLNSLKFARIQAKAGIKGTYFFRAVPVSWDEAIIREIAGMGHEVGYHYEDLSFAWAKLKAQDTGRRAQGREHRAQSAEHREEEMAKIAIESFKENLEKLRKFVPVKTICMHGSPMSRWDSRLLWKYFNYHDFGIVGEPYFDVNFDEVLYLTDTGRRWDGDSFNIRDKAEGGRREAEGNMMKNNLQPSALSLQPLASFPRFHSTFDIIKAAEEDRLPDKIMMTFHPQRWTDKPVPWVKELVWQNVKNVGKYFLIRLREEGDRQKAEGV